MKNNIIEVLPRNLQLKQKAIKTVIIVTLFTIVSTTLLYHISIWFDNNKIIFQSPIEIDIKTPIYIQDRGTAHAREWVKKALAQEPQITNEALKKVVNSTVDIKKDATVSDVEAYIRKVWAKEGSEQVRIALAVSSAENGTRQCDRTNVNKNGSIDVGIFQMNSIHNHKGELWKLGKLVDCYNNIDRAYELWKSAGWGAWSAYNNGAYKKKLSLYK